MGLKDRSAVCLAATLLRTRDLLMVWSQCLWLVHLTFAIRLDDTALHSRHDLRRAKRWQWHRLKHRG